MTRISFKRHRFPPEIIRHAVWLYARFTLSFRDVEDLLAERGIDISNETVRRWFRKFGRLVAVNLRHSRPRASARWHLDELVIKIRGRKHWLWRAVDFDMEAFAPKPARESLRAGYRGTEPLKMAGFVDTYYHRGPVGRVSALGQYTTGREEGRSRKGACQEFTPSHSLIPVHQLAWVH